MCFSSQPPDASPVHGGLYGDVQCIIGNGRMGPCEQTDAHGEYDLKFCYELFYIAWL